MPDLHRQSVFECGMASTVDLTEDDTPWNALANLLGEIESPGEQVVSPRSSSHKAIFGRFLRRIAMHQACLRVGLKMYQPFTLGLK